MSDSKNGKKMENLNNSSKRKEKMDEWGIELMVF